MSKKILTAIAFASTILLYGLREEANLSLEKKSAVCYAIEKSEGFPHATYKYWGIYRLVSQEDK